MTISAYDAVKELDGKWPTTMAGHLVAVGNALIDRRESVDSCFVCSRSEFDDEVYELQLSKEAAASSRMAALAIAKFGKWLESDLGIFPPEGYQINGYEIAEKDESSAMITVSYFNTKPSTDVSDWYAEKEIEAKWSEIPDFSIRVN